jgi:serine/threonine protein kinase
MGEVYRARDTKLGGDVALKFLPEAFAHDADRMVRFQREAQVLASLNHTNIAAIYGLDVNGRIVAPSSPDWRRSNQISSRAKTAKSVPASATSLYALDPVIPATGERKTSSPPATPAVRMPARRA